MLNVAVLVRQPTAVPSDRVDPAAVAEKAQTIQLQGVSSPTDFFFLLRVECSSCVDQLDPMFAFFFWWRKGKSGALIELSLYSTVPQNLKLVCSGA